METDDRLRYSHPSAVQVRVGGTLVNPQTEVRVQSSFFVRTETVEERTKVIAAWDEIMTAAALKVQEIVGRA